MSAYQYLCLSAIGLMVLGWTTRARAAGDDVTILKPNAADASTANASGATNPDGTPVIHKSSHRKKNASAVASAGVKTTTGSATSSTAPAKNPPVTSATTAAAPPPVPARVPPTPVPQPLTPISVASGPAAAPTVETGLPVARPGATAAIVTPTPYSPQGAAPTAPDGAVVHRPYTPYRPNEVTTLASLSGHPTETGGSTVTGGIGTYSPNTKPQDNFKFANFDKRTQTYPWKQEIVTTIFWIGEGATPISSTTNVASAWDEDWRRSNSGSDSPDDKTGYVSGSHASTLNPFYVALPFNDLSEPEKARRWLPAGWYHPPRNGDKPSSACKNRWVEIKNRQGEYCYAQWEDVGPLRSDDAEYVFGPERPEAMEGHHAGLDVSPAVARYLHIDGKNDVTAWRFVDDADVPPGLWLKYGEEALLYQAFKTMKNSRVNEIPIQRSATPIEDPSTQEANEKKVSGARG